MPNSTSGCQVNGSVCHSNISSGYHQDLCGFTLFVSISRIWEPYIVTIGIMRKCLNIKIIISPTKLCKLIKLTCFILASCSF